MATASITARPQVSYNHNYSGSYDDAMVFCRDVAGSPKTQHDQHVRAMRRQSAPRATGNAQKQPRRNGSVLVPTPSNTNQSQSQAPAGGNALSFYVPEGTPCYVSSDDGVWHSGVWGDNHRSITVYRSRRGPDPVFVRFADVVLKDPEGYPMYMAANRGRPCFISFPRDLPISLYIETSGQRRNPSQAQGFEPVSVEDAFAMGMNQHQQNLLSRAQSDSSIRTETSSVSSDSAPEYLR